MQFTPLTAADFDQPGEPIQAGPFSVTILHDEFAEHPADNDEGFPPAIHTYSNGEGVSRETVEPHFFSTVSARWCSRHWRAICGILDIDPAKHDQDARDYAAGGYSLSDARQEMFAEDLKEMVPGGYSGRISPSDWLDALAALYTLAGSPAYHLTRTGYCQGHYVYALIVYTPDFCKRMGVDPKRQDMENDAAAMADQIAAWAFGDCYGYTIEDADGETLDSCFGYLGAWWSEAGEHLLSEINDSLRHQFRHHELAGLAMTPEAVQAATMEAMQ